MTTTDAPVGVFFAPDVEPTLSLVGLVVAALAVGFLAWSFRVSADGRLVVRNLLITLTVPREHVRSVEIDEARPSGQGLAVVVRTHEDLRFRLDATLWPSPARVEGQAEALRSWRDGRPQAFL